jgi:nicotinamidase/pyrazinamidase
MSESMSDRYEHTSLLVVDVQRDFCAGGALPVPGGEEVVPVVNHLMRGFGSVVATQDWHTPGHISFASTHAGKNPFDRLMVNGIEQVLWPDHCVQGSTGAAFHPDLDVDSLHLILRKGFRPDLDSYSAFFENDRQTPTGLSSYLREIGVSSLYLCGLAADVCVFYSAMDAVRIGYKIFIIEDAVRGVDVPPGNISRTRREMKTAGVGFVHSTEMGV